MSVSSLETCQRRPHITLPPVTLRGNIVNDTLHTVRMLTGSNFQRLLEQVHLEQ